MPKSVMYRYVHVSIRYRRHAQERSRSLRAAVASEVREVGSGGLAMQIVKDSNAFAAHPERSAGARRQQ